jgi:hypothetical protein
MTGVFPTFCRGGGEERGKLYFDRLVGAGYFVFLTGTIAWPDGCRIEGWVVWLHDDRLRGWVGGRVMLL